MAKFTNTQYKDTINNLVQAQTSKLDNPYYMYSDQKGTIVEYYAQNIEKTTLDQAAKIEYSKLGKNSPIKFNLVHEFVIYGIDRITLNLNSGDFGLEADPIEGEAVILPNTLVPTPGDYFIIPYIKEDVLFYVNDCNFDTLDTGANIYKVSYRLQYSQKEKIKELKSQVVKEFNYIVSTVGTNFKTIIESNDYNLMKEIEGLKETLIGYFKDLFFEDKVQTFTYLYNCSKFYDPYSIEFMIRNKIFSSTDKYTYVTHQIENKRNFNLCYDKSFFNSLETHNTSDPQGTINANCTAIEDSNTLFGIRADIYYSVDYFSDYPLGNRIPIIPAEIITHVLNNEYYPITHDLAIFNTWIAYYNNNIEYIKGEYLDILKHYKWYCNNTCYYGMLINIFIIGKYIESMLFQHSSN